MIDYLSQARHAGVAQAFPELSERQRETLGLIAQRHNFIRAVECVLGVQAQVMSAAELSIGARVDGLERLAEGRIFEYWSHATCFLYARTSQARWWNVPSGTRLRRSWCATLTLPT